MPEPSHVDATVRWRPSLGGVRGLAVLCVVAFHAGIPVQSGGVAGVTLFFVLSGYLIGTLLMREREATGTIDVQRFFARRAWRLLPALVAVMIALAMLRFAAGDAHELAEDSLLTLVYLANWARSAGDQMGWWNHAWSLSVEGQFYVLAPLTMLVLARAWRPSSQRLIVALVVAIGGVMLWRAALAEGGASSARIYFGTDTRADALLLGCLLAAIRETPWLEPDSVIGADRAVLVRSPRRPAARRVRTEQRVWIDSTRIDGRRRGSARRRPRLARSRRSAARLVGRAVVLAVPGPCPGVHVSEPVAGNARARRPGRYTGRGSRGSVGASLPVRRASAQARARARWWGGRACVKAAGRGW